ncbi:transcription elongation GreA/GreB family factor [Pedobacter sp. UYP30]|uniref:3-oxoacyl-ACP synthase n=1 Tax=Pedobacter sp. UYP30 TaxID=1756400 RepID=UPI0033984FA1
MINSSTLKFQLHKLCLAFIQKRIENIEHSLAQARQASNDDTKSSAGDKYETTREMMQQEMDRNNKLLYEAGMQKMALQQIERTSVSSSVQNGSLVFTSRGNFYLSISAGELTVDTDKYIAVSQASPIGRMLIGKTKKEEFVFNGNKFLIQEIF